MCIRDSTDAADGGGARSAAVVQTGVLHTLFPAVAAADRTSGRVRVRKLYPSLTNTDTAPLLGATAAINERPGDPGVSVAMFRNGGTTTTRAQALAALYTLYAGTLTTTWNRYTAGGPAETADQLSVARVNTTTPAPVAGAQLAVCLLYTSDAADDTR